MAKNNTLRLLLHNIELNLIFVLIINCTKNEKKTCLWDIKILNCTHYTFMKILCKIVSIKKMKFFSSNE